MTRRKVAGSEGGRAETKVVCIRENAQRGETDVLAKEASSGVSKPAGYAKPACPGSIADQFGNFRVVNVVVHCIKSLAVETQRYVAKIAS